MVYKVEITNCDDSCADALVRIEPPVRFISEESRQVFGQTVLSIIERRVDPSSIANGRVELTHDLPSGRATIGYAKLPALKYGSGKTILQEALLLALNGEQ